jgi:hypothetical protein
MKPREFDGDWEALLTFRRHMPTAEFPYEFHTLDAQLCVLNSGAYCLVREDRSSLDFESGIAERVMLIFWAASERGARLVAGDKPQAPEADLGASPPPSALPLPGRAKSWVNADVIKEAKRQKIVPLESALYCRSGFRFRIVCAPPYEVLYASRNPYSDELPFAVKLLLK